MSASLYMVIPLNGVPKKKFSGMSQSKMLLEARNTRLFSVYRCLHLGVDFGTSGARASVIDDCEVQYYEAKTQYDLIEGELWDRSWERALDTILLGIPDDICGNIASLAFDGTSSTTLLVDVKSGTCVEPPKWYYEAQNKEAQQLAQKIAPEGHQARAATSTFCKVLQWHLNNTWQKHQQDGKNIRIMHQADWLAFLLHGVTDHSDYTNALKLGYDPEAEDYPDWIKRQEFFSLLPQSITAPGTPIGTLLRKKSQKYGLKENCVICSGTTDSIAAFLAAGATELGEAVTSLGSTLAIKMLSKKRVDDVNYGIYSHRLGDLWLVGGASNTGGAVLSEFFTNNQLQSLSAKINPAETSGLDYYPLLSPGERFPINDPEFQPKLQPRPSSDAKFLHGMLEGIAVIERQGYELLHQFGAGKVQKVYTAGGGAINETWTKIRTAQLGVPVVAATQGEASYGAAILAKTGSQR